MKRLLWIVLVGLWVVPIAAQDDLNVVRLEFEQGRGAVSPSWEVYFTEPTGNRDRSTYVNGIDIAIATSIDAVEATLDIAAFELNNEVITAAITRAHERGVQIRIVTDDEHGIFDDDTTLVELELLGIPIVNDDRSGLMHNKFMILDSQRVWLGSMNFTVNGVYRNNNNALLLTSSAAVTAYQAEFDEMFIDGRFGITSPEGTAEFVQDGIDIGIYFASEDDVITQILDEINSADEQIRFMAFSFTRDDMGQAMVAQHQAGIDVQGIFERVGSGTEFSEMGRLFCNGVDARRDFNRYILHHKVVIIDDHTVITGSFNFSNNAVSQNDENLMIIRDPALAALYLEEYQRMLDNSGVPDYVDCATHPDSPVQEPDALIELFREAYVLRLRDTAQDWNDALDDVLAGAMMFCPIAIDSVRDYDVPELLLDNDTHTQRASVYNQVAAAVKELDDRFDATCDAGETYDAETIATFQATLQSAIDILNNINTAMLNE